MAIISAVVTFICVMALFFFGFFLGYREGMATMKRIDDNIIEEAERTIYGKESAYSDGYKAGREAEKVRQPDFERIKKTAHDDGYSEGYQAGREEAYLKGLNDGQGVILESTQNNAFNSGYKKCLEDMEQVRKEERDRGHDDGYQRGLADAWEVARKIQDTGGNLNWWIHNTTGTEAIEKIRQYEQGKQETFLVGDEVVSEDDIKATVIDMDDYLLHVLDENGVVQGWPREDVAKTDRRFSEIATVLEKMRGEQS